MCLVPSDFQSECTSTCFFLSDFGELEHLLGRLSTPKNCKLENGLRHFLRFALSYGSECGSWDMQTCATNYRPDQVDLWCCSSWCYVDKEMTSNPSPKKGDGMEGTNVTRQSCEIWKARFKAPSFALPSRGRCDPTGARSALRPSPP